MKKNKAKYAIEKKGCRVACPIRNISEPNSHVKKPAKPRNATMKMYETSESKNELNSLFAIIQIECIVSLI
jgi:hypothetical protein